MPYVWEHSDDHDSLRLWPHRSLPPTGFVWFISITAGLFGLPLIALLGSVILWGLLPFILAALWAVWWAIERSYQTGRTSEDVFLNDNILRITRRDPGREDRLWEANPYWVRPVIRSGPVEDYLVLDGGQREVELGAFLTPKERRRLKGELSTALNHRRSALRPPFG